MVLSPMAVFANENTDTDANTDPALVAPMEDTKSPAESKGVTSGWNEDRTQYFDENGDAVTGLFKAARKDGGMSLFYADADGFVKKTEKFITVSTGARFVHRPTEDGYWDPVSSGTYSYVITNHNGEYFVQFKEGFYTVGGKKYYVQNNGTVMPGTGLRTIKSNKYFIQSDSSIRTTAGFITNGGAKYYIRSDGSIPTKACIITVGNYKYYNTTGGAIRTKKGKFKLNNKFYFVKNTNGVLAANAAVKYKGKLYHAKKNSELAVGVHKWKNKKYYYGKPKSGVIKKTAGVVSHNKKYYFVQKGGKIATSKRVRYKGKSYIATKYGYFKTGLFKWKGDLYYASKKGTLKTKKGFVTVNNVRYFVFAGGKVAINDMFTYNGDKYITDSKGQLRKGFINYNGNTYYAYKDGTIETNKGLKTINGKTYFIKKGGKFAKNAFVKDSGRYYYVGRDGVVVKSTFTYNGVQVTPNSSTGEISKEDYTNAKNGNNGENNTP